jgi:flagellar biosynthesis protein FlhG
MLKKLALIADRWLESNRRNPYTTSLSETDDVLDSSQDEASAWQAEIATLPMPGDSSEASATGHRVIAVGSGKGGVGKTVVSSSIALSLAKTHLSPVTALDVDLGGANLHTGLGIPHPSFALNHFLQDGACLEDLAVPTGIEGLEYIGGASDVVGITEFTDEHRERFFSDLSDFQKGTTILDLGAGSSLFNLDLFSLADQGILVTTPEPTAVQNAYGFLRAAVYRRIRLLFAGEDGLVEMIESAMNHHGKDSEDTVPSLIRQISRYNRSAADEVDEVVKRIQVGVVVNMHDNGDGEQVSEKLSQVARQYLGIRLENLGTVPRDDTVHRAICSWRPLVLHYPKAKAARRLGGVAERILGKLDQKESLSA